MNYRESIKDPKIKAKIQEEESLLYRAKELFDTYGKVGATWAACVQAVKTDWVGNFQAKWSNK